EAGEMTGHEYWYADGETIGYHGRRADGSKYFGHINYDNTDEVEVSFPHETGHIHSNDANLIVGDGGSVIRRWKWNGRDYEGPRVLCLHGSTSKIQHVHVHPRFTADGSKVVYTSDVSGYGNVYEVEVPEFESLPRLEDVEAK